MVIYLIIGLVWSLFFEWMLRNFSPTGEGLPTHRARIFHMLLWPVAIFLVIRNFKDE